jgi:hypothetical protein
MYFHVSCRCPGQLPRLPSPIATPPGSHLSRSRREFSGPYRADVEASSPVLHRFSVQVSVLSHPKSLQSKAAQRFARQSLNRLFRCAIIVLRSSTYYAVTIPVRTLYFTKAPKVTCSATNPTSSPARPKGHSGGRGAFSGF